MMLKTDDGKILIDSEDEKIVAKVRHYIANPPETSRVMTLTPGACFRLLNDYNFVSGLPNRPKKPKRIAIYAADMQSGEWFVTGTPIAFSDKNRLADGQNRLMASVQSGMPFKTHVVFGVPDEAFDRIDRGKPRDASDMLHIAGYTNTTVLAGAVRIAHLIETGHIKARTSLEPKDIRRLLIDRYPTMPDFVSPARAIYDVTHQPSSMVCPLLYLFDKKSPRAAADFATAWAGGQWGGKYNPIKLMQAAVTTLHQASLGRVHDTVRLAYIIQAWNLFITGRKGSKTSIAWQLADDFPVIAGLGE